MLMCHIKIEISVLSIGVGIGKPTMGIQKLKQKYNRQNYEQNNIYPSLVKDALLYFTNCGHEHRRREIVLTSVKQEAERSEAASEGALYKT